MKKSFCGHFDGIVIDGIHKGKKCYRRKYARGFVEVYLKQSAMITLVLENGNIIFEGLVEELDSKLLTDFYIKDVCGLGSLDDIIITITKEAEFYE